MKCPICDNENNNLIFQVKEMQQGLREEFEYVECSNCGCLFIKEIPRNLDKYYDNEYDPHNFNSTIKNRIYDKLYGLYYANNKLITYIRSNWGGDLVITTKFWNSLSAKGIMNKNSSILDIGCGNGHFLKVLKMGGFRDLTGVDLFVDEENMLKGIKIFQSSLEDFKPNRKYDVIISDHSFEHMINQLENLKCFENLVNDDGIIVIRMPVKSKPIWEKYGVNWFHIDAPRHYLIHTLESFKILCNKTNLVIKDIIFDSGDYNLLFSERYSRNISVRDNEWNTFEFDDSTTKKLKDEVKMLNQNNQGDQAIFVLKLKK